MNNKGRATKQFIYLAHMESSGGDNYYFAFSKEPSTKQVMDLCPEGDEQDVEDGNVSLNVTRVEVCS